MDNTEKARELINKHLYLHGGDGLGITDGDVYRAVLDAVSEALTIPVVVKSLPTDECVEQWWAEGQDQKEGFWQEAPYRTNGDVVEEIKTALKYFIETWQR